MFHVVHRTHTQTNILTTSIRQFAVTSKKKAVESNSSYRTHWFMSPILGIPFSYRSIDAQHAYHLLKNKPTSRDLHEDQIECLQSEIGVTDDLLQNTHMLPNESCPFNRLSLSDTELKGFDNTKISVAAYSVAQCPPIRDFIRDAEIMVTGRSNVGKSSLLNALFNNQQALASQKPGKTQSLNFYPLAPSTLQRHITRYQDLAACSPSDLAKEIDFMDNMRFGMDDPPSDAQATALHYMFTRAGHSPLMMIVDVPGYGFARAPDAAVDIWNYLIGGYIKQRSPQRWPVSLGLGKSKGTAPITPIASANGYALYKEMPKYPIGRNGHSSSSSSSSVRGRKLDNTLNENNNSNNNNNTNDDDSDIIDRQKKTKRLGKPMSFTEQFQLKFAKTDQKIPAKVAIDIATNRKSSKKGQMVASNIVNTNENTSTSTPTSTSTSIDDITNIVDNTTSHQSYNTNIELTTVDCPAISLAGPPHGSNLRLALVLVDARAGLSKQDKEFCDFLEAHSVPYQICLTKVDRIGPFKLKSAVQQVAKVLFPNSQKKYTDAQNQIQKLKEKKLTSSSTITSTSSGTSATSTNDTNIDADTESIVDENGYYSLFHPDGSLNLEALAKACEGETSDAPVFKIHADLPFARTQKDADEAAKETETDNTKSKNNKKKKTSKVDVDEKEKEKEKEKKKQNKHDHSHQTHDERAEAPALGQPDRRFCSPVLITLSSNSEIGISTLKRAMLSACIV